MNKGDLVFVYGTLRTGERMDLGAGFYAGMCRKVGDDMVNARLYDLGSFPGVKNASDFGDIDYIVCGEVFEITDDGLPMLLDSYEGYPNLYSRQQVKSAGGHTVWVYTYNGRVNEDMLITSGDWKMRVSRVAA